MKRHLALYGKIFVSIVLIDQTTKWLILLYKRTLTLTPFLSFELTFNRGISWGLFSSRSVIPFVGISVGIAVLTFFLAWYAYDRYRRGYGILAEVFIIAGSCSNLIDRIVHGGVVDFILFHWGDLIWPYFNLADAFVVSGVMLIFMRQILQKEQSS